MTSRGASDFHLTVGRPPMLRVSGAMEPIRYRTLPEADYVELVRPIVPARLWEEFTATGDADLSYEVPGLARFRVNLFRQQRGSGAVFRIIPTKIMTLEQLGMPEPVRRLAAMESGLVLVTGPTGSGKSTTLAAIINLINETKNYHVITIEDPIEFVHPNKKCLIHQREIGTHATSFAEALKAAGREDPDLILVGEMRDLETISMALSAAEKGTIVFGTLHTNNASKTVDRIISVFPASEQDGHPQRARRDAAGGGGPAAHPEDRRRPRGGHRDPLLLARDRQHDPRGQDHDDHLRHPDRGQGGHDRHGLVDPDASTTRRRSAPAPPSTRRSTSPSSRTCSRRARRRARTEERPAAASSALLGRGEAEDERDAESLVQLLVGGEHLEAGVDAARV